MGIYHKIGGVQVKIAFPVNEKSIEAEINNVFGRSNFFLLADSETLEYEIFENPAVSAAGGAGIVAAQKVVDIGADAVITYQCGKNALDVLEAANVNIIGAVPGSIRVILDRFNAGELTSEAKKHGGFHDHGAR